MECDAFREDLLDVLYGEADTATAHRFNQHQAHCAACREEIASFRRVRHELDGWAVAPKRRLTLSATLRPLRVLAAAAAVLVALGGALVLARGEVRTSALRLLLAEQEERHQREIADVKAAATRVAAQPVALDQAALLAEIRRLVKESETRQAAVFTAGLTDLEERAEAQRRVDLAQVGAGLSYLDGKTGLQAARTTELMGKVLLASQGPR